LEFERASGILLHISSLPGGFGIGDLGPSAYQWVDFLVESGCTYWQFLPTGPTGFGDSPYQCFSAIAGNQYLISPELLIEDGLLLVNDLKKIPEFEENRINFEELIPWKIDILNKSFSRFQKDKKIQNEFTEFVEQEKSWLEYYALFMAIKDSQGQSSWSTWPEELRDRKGEAINRFISEHNQDIERHKFFQFAFFRQWGNLRDYANSRGVKFVGDLPIYVAHDSVDVWASQDLYYLSTDGNPEVLAGVPPDYFSPHGQLWGNPIYRWELHKQTGYQWWIERVAKLYEMVDVVRIDHFRGFAGYWEVPAGNETAEIGRWMPGPGSPFFQALKDNFGDAPMIVEDLGEITPDVIQLRDQFGFPGMRILQFAFDGDDHHPFLPHMYPEHCAAYTGTHDNESIMGWYHTAPDWNKSVMARHLERFGSGLPWSMIEYLWESRARLVFIQMQDALALGTEARMNFPGTTQGNWSWRMRSEALSVPLKDRLKHINIKYNRLTFDDLL
jgi:4-alpha-glucanotransferase